MTGLQRRQLLTYASEILVAGLERGSRQRHEGTKWWQIEMPAVAWRMLIAQLRPRLDGPRGGYQHATHSLRVALQRAATELNRLQHHPALTESSLMGWHTETIPVWEVPGLPNPRYSIFPIPQARFVILTDHHFKVRGFDLTCWAPGEPSGGLTHEESEHLVFCVEQR